MASDEGDDFRLRSNSLDSTLRPKHSLVPSIIAPSRILSKIFHSKSLDAIKPQGDRPKHKDSDTPTSGPAPPTTEDRATETPVKCRLKRIVKDDESAGAEYGNRYLTRRYTVPYSQKNTHDTSSVHNKDTNSSRYTTEETTTMHHSATGANAAHETSTVHHNDTRSNKPRTTAVHQNHSDTPRSSANPYHTILKKPHHSVVSSEPSPVSISDNGHQCSPEGKPHSKNKHAMFLEEVDVVEYNAEQTISKEVVHRHHAHLMDSIEEFEENTNEDFNQCELAHMKRELNDMNIRIEDLVKENQWLRLKISSLEERQEKHEYVCALLKQ